MTVYHDAAKRMADEMGIDDAIMEALRAMNESSQGTISHSFHYATWKILRNMQEAQQVESEIVRDEIRRGDY